MTIPDWTTEHLLPPIRPGLGDVAADRSPYRCTMRDVVRRFGVKAERHMILAGLLEYRQALRDAGVLTGFQWLNGSFVEDVEAREERPPNDIDVVTFAALGDLPLEEKLQQDHPVLFNPASRYHLICKQTYHVDRYWVNLSTSARRVLEWGTYWYSMWSHRRGDRLWKGFLQVELDETEGLDVQAAELLRVRSAQTPDGG